MKLYRPYLTDVSSHVLPSASGTLNLGAAALAWNNAFINKAYLAADPISPLQAATKQYVDNAVSGEDLWDRSGTDLTPVNSGDNIILTGALKIDNDNEKITLGAGAQDFYAYFDGTQGVLETSDSDLKIEALGGNLGLYSEGKIDFYANSDFGSTSITFKSQFLDSLVTGTTDNNSLVTKGYVDDAIAVENLWDRSGTDLSPHNVGDTITADGGLTIGSAGDLTLEDSTSGATRSITVADQTIVDAYGNQLDIKAGKGNGINDGGKLRLYGGDGGDTSGSGGAIELRGGNPVAGASAGGKISLTAGSAGDQGSGGNIDLTAGDGGYTTLGNGGNVLIYAGYAQAGNSNGGNIYIGIGEGTGSGSNGAVYIEGVVEVTGNILPEASGTRDLGTIATAFASGYIDEVYLNADPTDPLQAATKQYVDSAISGENWWQRGGTTLSPENANDGLSIAGDTIFNVNTQDVDFTVRTTSDANAFVIHGSTDIIGLGVDVSPDASGTLSLGSVASAFNEAHINKVYLEGDPTTGFEAATKDYVDVQIVAGGGTLQTVTDAGATTSNSMTTSANMTIGEYLYHDGDADTWARFGDNSFTVNTAGVEMAKFTGGTEVVFNDGAQDVDFRVEADNQPNAIKIDGGDGSFTYNTSTSNSSLTPFQVKDSLGYPLITCKVTNTSGSAAGSEIVFNDLSLDYDLRVESDTRTNAFSVNGETGNVGIGQGGAASRLTVYDAANSIIQLCNFDTGVVAGKGTTLYQNSYSSGIGFSSLVTDFTINEGGLDIDFRVESNTHTDAFVLHGDYGSVTFGAANTKYVSIDEDIEAVISAASNGDALVLAAGTFTITNTITVGKRVHLKGQGRGITTIYCSTDIASNSMIQFTTTAGSLISDMTVHLDSATSSNSQILRYDVDVDVLNLELIDTTTGSNQPYGVYNSSSNATMNLWNTTYAGSGANSQHCFVIVSGGNSYANLYDCSATSADGTSSSTGNTLLRTWTGSTNYINVYGGTYESATNASAGGVVYCANGAINLYGATINGSGASAFDVRRDAGSLTLYDTTLVNNTISGTVSYGGTVTAANGEFSPDSDHVGGVIASRAKMGTPTAGGGDFAYFGHLDYFADGNSFALAQGPAGQTYLSGATNQDIKVFARGTGNSSLESGSGTHYIQLADTGEINHSGSIIPNPSGTLDIGSLAFAYNAAYIDSVYLEGDPTDGLEATTKDYVDSLVQGLDWQHSVLSRLGSPPGGPGTGDRYIATATASGWTENNIYQYQSGWDETVANEGMATWVEDEDKQYTYNGVEWVTFGSTSVHNNMSGLQGGTSGEYYHLTAAEYATVDSDTLSDVTGRGATTTDAVGTSTLTITNNSDTVVLDHDGNDAQMTWSDGSLYFETSEGTNTTTIVWAKAHGAIPAYSYIGAETAGSFVNFFAGNTGTGIFYDSADTFQIWGQPYADRGTVTNLTERFSISSAGVIEFNNAYAFPSATGTEGQVLKVQADTSVLDWAESGGVTTYAEAFNDGDLTAGILTVTHNLASNYPNVAVYDNSNNQIGPDEITNTDSNTTTIDLSSFGTITGTWNVRVSVGAGGTPSGGSPVGGAGAIQFSDGSDFDGDETKLYWNSASNRLSVGTNVQNKDGITVYSSSTPYVEFYNGSTGTTAADGAGIALDGNLDFWLINREVGDINMYTGSQTVLSAQNGNKVAIAGSHVATSELDVAGDIEVGSTDAFYMGDPTTDGTWRFVRSGDDLVIQRRESSSWVTKSTVVA